MHILALLSFCGVLAIALAQHGHVQVEQIVNDVIKPNDGLFSNIVEQFGIVSFSPTPSATTSVMPTTSPSASMHPSMFASSSPLASSSTLPLLAPSPSPFPSASPSSSISPMPSSEGRRPSSPDAVQPSASSAAALVTPSASATSSPTPSASPTPSSTPSASPTSSSTPSTTPSSSSTPSTTPSSSSSPSPSCAVSVERTNGVSGGPEGTPFSDFSRVASTGTLNKVRISADGVGLRFYTSMGTLGAGENTFEGVSATTPFGITVQTATACSNATDVNYIAFLLSDGRDVSFSGTQQPTSGCVTVTAPPGGEILGSEGRVFSNRLKALNFITRVIVC